MKWEQNEYGKKKRVQLAQPLILSRHHHANTADSASTARRKVHFAAR